MDLVPAVLISVSGLVAIAGAAFDVDWFMNHRKAALVVAVLGRTGARAFYAVLGTVLIAAAIASYTPAP
jgi:hypothetical protein